MTAPFGPSHNAALRSASNHSAEYAERFAPPVSRFLWPTEMRAAQMLLAAGRGPARIPTCEHTLRHVRAEDRRHGPYLPMCFRALLVRALSLFGPDEMRALRVADPTTLFGIATPIPRKSSTRRSKEFAQSPTEAATANGGAPTPPSIPSSTFDSICSLSWGYDSADASAAFTFVERHAATLTVLDCPTARTSPAGDRALAACARLELLTHAGNFAPTAWLGLSQLHTLRGVDLNLAPIAAIAAALPRLHTLGAYVHTRDCPIDAVRGFFDDLLPRLRVLHFYGPWPQGYAPAAPAPQPLPLLQELVWEGSSSEVQVVRAFAGARPTKLHTSHAMLEEFLALMDHLGGGGTSESATNVADAPHVCGGGKASLSCLRDLCLYGPGASDPSRVARVLHTAPQLRVLAFINGLRGAPAWYALTAGAPADPAFDGLVHFKLRSLRIESEEPEPIALHADCAARLRQLHFPRLQQLTVDKRVYPENASADGGSGG